MAVENPPEAAAERFRAGDTDGLGPVPGQDCGAAAPPGGAVRSEPLYIPGFSPSHFHSVAVAQADQAGGDSDPKLLQVAPV